MSDPLKEIADRVRRIETRLTRYLKDRGFDTQTKVPEYKHDAIHAPSPEVSLQACVDVIPKSRTAIVPVYVGTDLVGYVARR